MLRTDEHREVTVFNILILRKAKSSAFSVILVRTLDECIAIFYYFRNVSFTQLVA